MLIFTFATYSRRRGPMRARRTDPRTSPLEFIEMLGALYRRAGAAPAAGAAARLGLKRTIAAAQGIPVDSPDAAIAHAIAARSAADVHEVLDVLAAADRAERESELDAAEAVRLTRRLQQLTAGVERVALAG